jgi:GTP cyclohydrolase FolE2
LRGEDTEKRNFCIMANDAAEISDVQLLPDSRRVAVNQVGIKALRLPLVFRDGGETRHTVADAAVYTDLGGALRGTHMSRLVEILNAAAADFSYQRFAELPGEICERLGAQQCGLRLAFAYFESKKAPVSGRDGWIDSDAVFSAHTGDDKNARFIVQATTPVTSLCPCSKAISRYGAHNQRSHVAAAVEPANGGDAVIGELVRLIEKSASAELFAVLKRRDEKFVTERAYDNPKFVEDIVRDLSLALSSDSAFAQWRVEAENFESIHNHSAYAMVESAGFPAWFPQAR